MVRVLPDTQIYDQLAASLQELYTRGVLQLQRYTYLMENLCKHIYMPFETMGSKRKQDESWFNYLVHTPGLYRQCTINTAEPAACFSHNFFSTNQFAELETPVQAS